MKSNDYAQLLRIAGTVEGILNAPFCGRLTIDRVQNAERWAHAGVTFGLTVTGTRADAVAMRRLVDAGYIEAAGQTLGRSHRLTVRGWFTAAAWLGCDPEALRVLLKKVSAIQAKSKVTMPGDKQTRLCMTWHLVPSCGAWLSSLRTPAAIEQFKSEASTIEARLVPLIALGWLTRFVAPSGQFWGLSLTEAGRAVLNDWPTFETPRDMPSADSEAVFSAWQQGYEKGKALVRTSPPDSVKNTIARLLPASAWM